MKRRTYWSEGLVIGAALAALLALSFALWLDRQPRIQTAAPIHSVVLEELERAATVDVNSAPAEELEWLPGIGPVLAAAIIDYREENGPFASADELTNVYGIGPVKLEEMRPYLRLN